MGFYIVAPILVVIFHFHYLLNLLQHARILKAWDEAKTNQQKVLLPGFIFNFSILFKNINVNYRLLRFLQAAILFWLPLLTLLFIQMRFGDYRSIIMTYWHALFFMIEVFIITLYWYPINFPVLLDEKYDELRTLFRSFGLAWKKKGEGEEFDPPQRIISLGYLKASGFLMFASLFYTLVILTNLTLEHRYFFTPYINVSGETLVKPPSDLIIHAYLLQRKSLDSAWLEHGQGIDLSGRNLQYADFRGADLKMVSLVGSNLNGCTLDSANLNYANLINARLNHASLRGVSMKQAVADSAQFNYSDLRNANLNGIRLNVASLNGANLFQAKLNGANLESAQLNGACLSWAQLNGADLSYAQLNGASLIFAELNGAELSFAQLNGAFLSRAELNGTELFLTQLNGADLESVQLNGASIYNAQLNGVYFDVARIRGLTFFEFSEFKGIFFNTPPDTITIPDWDSLITALEGLISISPLKENALERLRSSKEVSNNLAPELRELKPDLAGLIEVRKILSCQSKYIAVGMLRQSLEHPPIIRYHLPIQVLENILHHMAQNCPDTLAAAQTLLPVYLINVIDSIMQEMK